MTEEPGRSQIDRRSLLKRGAVASAAAWTVPVIYDSFTAPASASGTAVGPLPTTPSSTPTQVTIPTNRAVNYTIIGGGGGGGFWNSYNGGSGVKVTGQIAPNASGWTLNVYLGGGGKGGTDSHSNSNGGVGYGTGAKLAATAAMATAAGAEAVPPRSCRPTEPQWSSSLPVVVAPVVVATRLVPDSGGPGGATRRIRPGRSRPSLRATTAQTATGTTPAARVAVEAPREAEAEAARTEAPTRQPVTQGPAQTGATVATAPTTGVGTGAVVEPDAMGVVAAEVQPSAARVGVRTTVVVAVAVPARRSPLDPLARRAPRAMPILEARRPPQESGQEPVTAGRVGTPAAGVVPLATAAMGR